MKIRKNEYKCQTDYIRHSRQCKRRIFFSRIILFVMFIALWESASFFGWIDSFYFSSPSEIAALFVHDIKNRTLVGHIGITLVESAVSFMLIILCSLMMATFFWFYPSIGKVCEPYLVVLNSLPKSALAPLIIVWLGTGSRTIILCGMSVGIFGCILNMYQSFADTDPERLKLIETLGGSRIQAFTKVVFPGNIPAFISLSKVNIGLALVGVIIGEFLAGRQGLGYLIIYGSQVFKLDMVIMSIVILCLIAMVIYWALNRVERWIFKNREKNTTAV